MVRGLMALLCPPVIGYRSRGFGLSFLYQTLGRHTFDARGRSQDLRVIPHCSTNRSFDAVATDQYHLAREMRKDTLVKGAAGVGSTPARRSARRAQITARAARMFHQQGYAATSMQQIADA